MKTQSGFTLLELATLLLLISIASLIMLPNLQALLNRSYAEQHKDLLVSHLNHARSYAITEMSRVELCGSSNGNDCDQQWQQGWLTRTQDGQILQVQAANPSASRLLWRGFNTSITFLPNGTSNASNGQFVLCDAQGNLHWQIILNRQGRIRAQRPADDSSTRC